MNKLPDKPDFLAIAKADEALVLELIAEAASRLKALKSEARAAARKSGMIESQIEALSPPYPAGAIGVDVKGK